MLLFLWLIDFLSCTFKRRFACETRHVLCGRRPVRCPWPRRLFILPVVPWHYTIDWGWWGDAGEKCETITAARGRVVRRMRRAVNDRSVTAAEMRLHWRCQLRRDVFTIWHCMNHLWHILFRHFDKVFGKCCSNHRKSMLISLPKWRRFLKQNSLFRIF